MDKVFSTENETTEFKSKLNEKLEREVVGFLNSKKGGDIYIGVSDNGDIIGIDEADKLQLIISDRIKNNILPTCLGLFDVVCEEKEDKNIIHIIVTRGTEKPYYLKKHGQSPAGCFIRIGSGLQQMTNAMIENLYASRTRNSLRNILAPTTQELTFRQLKIYYEDRGLDLNNSFLDSLDLKNSDGKINYVGYLLSDNNNVSIKVAKYASADKCDLIENEEYGFCSLIKATYRVLDKLEIENKTLTKITGKAQREQKNLINKQALREALINAIVHNDYTNEVPPVVEIYSDRLSITSYGGLVHGLSEDEFYSGRSMPRNRELMRVFRDMDLVEQLGSGIHRILKLYDKNIVKISEHFVEICFPFEETDPVTDPVREQVTEQVREQVREQVNELISCLNGEMSVQSLMKKLNLSARRHFIYNYLTPALELDFIEMTQPNSPKSPTQKYRLTQKGLDFKKQSKGKAHG